VLSHIVVVVATTAASANIVVVIVRRIRGFSRKTRVRRRSGRSCARVPFLPRS
jgi:hypothetical protein